MQGTKNTLEGLLKNLTEVSKHLPGELITAAQKMSKGDAQMVMKAMKDSDLESKMKELNVTKKDFHNFVKKHNVR